MPRILLLCLSLLSGIPLHAQDDPPSDSYVFADTAYVRNGPSTQGAPVDTLHAADAVTIVKQTGAEQSFKGFSAPWAQITYLKNGVAHAGYIWSGLLAIRPMRRGDTKFFFGIQRVYAKDTVIDKETVRLEQMLLGVKAYRQGAPVATLYYPVKYLADQRFRETHVSDGRGLKDVEYLLSFHMDGAACGIPGDTYYFGFRRNELVPVYSTSSVSDAGVFSYEEELVFPSDPSGRPDLITWKMRSEETTDRLDRRGNDIVKTSRGTKYFRWDGNRAVEVKRPGK